MSSQDWLRAGLESGRQRCEDRIAEKLDSYKFHKDAMKHAAQELLQWRERRDELDKLLSEE